MEVTYSLFDPTGNITLLVETPISAAERVAVASKLMELEPKAEQVGFVSQDDADVDIRLDMAGGEFCGNATMSAAALAVMRSGRTPKQGDPIGVTVRSSGASGPVTVALKAESDTAYYGSVIMPQPRSIDDAPFTVTGDGRKPVIVRFDGIAHVILERPAPEGERGRSRAEALARSWCEALGTDAIGILFFERHKLRLTPLVYVPAVGTVCWESACGSGTTAIGAYMADRTGKPVDITL
ncbi:MAG: hypothetical protein UHI93_06260, partial [Acutalibacteraceae bacterium]|nr:hypothetical protein [Acutalibacteraceae bacterium]